MRAIVCRSCGEPESLRLEQLATPRHGKHLRMVVLKANKDLSRAVELVRAGRLTPVLDRTFVLADTAAALRHFARAAHRGKVMIDVAGE